MNTIERYVITSYLKAGAQQGWELTLVDLDHDEPDPVSGLSIEDKVKAMDGFDELRVMFEHQLTHQRGVALFVFGNGGYGQDVLADYSVRLTFLDPRVDLRPLRSPVLTKEQINTLVTVVGQSALSEAEQEALEAALLDDMDLLRDLL